jgi:hypothetical protein
MEAALFTYRCFEKPEDKFPFSVGAFILRGQSEMLQEAAAREFDRLIGANPKIPARIHKVGPLTVYPMMRTQTAWQEINWTELSHRVKQEKPVRLENEGSCIFTMPSSEKGIWPPNIDLPPEIAAEAQKEFERAMLSLAPQAAVGRGFLFIGSAFRDDCNERTGIVYVIEAPSLTQASAICTGLVGNSWKTTVLVEWCCSINDVKSDAQAS